MNKGTILITGCSSGIGLASAKTLKEKGFSIIASARKTEDVTILKESGFNCVKLDLNCSNSIKSGIDDALQISNGSIDFLFNNGAYGQAGAVEDLSRRVIQDQFETNVFGTMELTNLIIPIMRKQGHGRIIFNSSILGFVSFKHRGAYVASKFAIEGFADTLRLELSGSGIYVSLIEPGPIRSAFRDNALKKFNENIDVENSVHREIYEATRKRLMKAPDAKTPFTLEPDAVIKKLLHAISAKRPRERYYVTFPTYLFGYLKRVLSTRMLDRVLEKSE
ncbi:MAG: SDR family NAD(P)-dependent oxidoreductase [Gammaproteobacteria bacterium]|nr:MAG: SDR family NAD(P)-dependent oxidoreductase [Gammaproteobacteria bacterium]